MAELSETSEKKMQQITCENDNCAHYISKRNVHFYKNKFLYIISAASLIFIITQVSDLEFKPFEHTL